MQQRFRNIIFPVSAFICLLFLLPSCRVAKNLPEGQTLLVKNKIVLDTKAKATDKQKIKADLPKIAAQKPNRKFIGFLPFRMWMYYRAARAKKLTKFRQWILD